MTIARVTDIASRYARIRDEVGPDVTVVVATKYVTAEEMSVLADAGVEVVGENRAQDLERKHGLHGDAFRWHFIGHLQSNKVKVVDELCELVHSVGSDSAARRITVPALLEVNLSAEDSKSGVPPAEIAGFVERYPLIRGLMRSGFGSSTRSRRSSWISSRPCRPIWRRRSRKPAAARLPAVFVPSTRRAAVAGVPWL